MAPPGRSAKRPAPGDNEESSSVCPEPVRAWLTQAVESGASDLHLVVGHPPVLRLHGTLEELADSSVDGDSLRRFLTPLCPEPIFSSFLSEKNADFSLELEIDGRPGAMPTLAWACAETSCESGMAKQVWPWQPPKHPSACWASIALGRQRFIGPHTVPALSGSPPWATAKSDQRFDALEQAGELVALPRPCANGTSILAEIRVERCPTACIFSHLSVPREPGQTQIMNDEL